jgi:hypothetical protein
MSTGPGGPPETQPYPEDDIVPIALNGDLHSLRSELSTADDGFYEPRYFRVQVASIEEQGAPVKIIR